MSEGTSLSWTLASDPFDGDEPPWDAWDEWKRVIKGLTLTSPLDEKARDAAVAYFEPGEGGSIKAVAGSLGVKRETAVRRLERAHERGWVTLGAVPLIAGEATLPRVCLRRVFWTDDYWTAFPEWEDSHGQAPF